MSIQPHAFIAPASGALRRRLVRSGLIASLIGVTALIGLGCDRNIEPFEPGEEPSPPDLARIFPAETNRPGGAEGGSGSAADGGATPRAAVPPSRAESGAANGQRGNVASPNAAGVSGPAGAAPIAGTIDIAPELAGAAPAGGILFIIARPQGAVGGPPLAVVRVPDPSFPLSFQVGPENVMIPSMQFRGPISLSARLDADGNAMTKGAEDLSSATESALSPGATGVQLLLSEKG